MIGAKIMSSLRNQYTRITNQRGNFATRDVTVDGQQGSANNMNVNGAGTPVQFWYQPAPTDLFRIDVVHLSIADNGAPGFDQYGSVPGPLPNGVRFFVDRGGVVQYLDRIYKTNTDVITVATGVEIHTMAVNTRIVEYRSEFAQYASGVLFSGASNDRFGVEIRDDLTALQVHNCMLSGAVFRVGN